MQIYTIFLLYQIFIIEFSIVFLIENYGEGVINYE